MIVTLPCALLLLDYWPLRRVQVGDAPSPASPFAQTSWPRLALEKLPLLVLSAASSAITLRAQKMSMATTEALPFSERLSNAIYSYVMYCGRRFGPRTSRFSIPMRETSWPVGALPFA